jgi:hypothetical protein
MQKLAIAFVSYLGLLACETRLAPPAAAPSSSVSSLTAPTPTGSHLALAPPAAREAPAAAPSCAQLPGPPSVALSEPVTLGHFWAALQQQVELLDTRSLDAAFAGFVERHQLDRQTPGLRRDFVRAWLAFEATRDGGWWRLRWDITDEEPSSVKIWRAWLRSPPEQAFASATAVAGRARRGLVLPHLEPRHRRLDSGGAGRPELGRRRAGPHDSNLPGL